MSVQNTRKTDYFGTFLRTLAEPQVTPAHPPPASIAAVPHAVASGSGQAVDDIIRVLLEAGGQAEFKDVVRQTSYTVGQTLSAIQSLVATGLVQMTGPVVALTPEGRETVKS